LSLKISGDGPSDRAAIAAPATTGLRKPNAARGIPKTL
jgi:hypothetical protein